MNPGSITEIQAIVMTYSLNIHRFVGTLPHLEERLLLNRFTFVGQFLDEASWHY